MATLFHPGREREDSPHVLAVDDSLVDLTLIKRLLQSSCCRVTTAENGMRALHYLHEIHHSSEKVNLIITDYCMPGMTGYELLVKIKESSVMRDLPVVVVSSESVSSRINACLEGGAQMFTLKPLKQSDVKKMLIFIN